MKLAFCLFKYFPYGGMQRDFLRIARACRRRGHEIHVYTLEWQGAPANEFDVNIVAARGITNHQRYSAFSEFFAGRRREYD
ncbi:MAG: glycosyltransferase, partial [Burkholderiales bacterium]